MIGRTAEEYASLLQRNRTGLDRRRLLTLGACLAGSLLLPSMGLARLAQTGSRFRDTMLNPILGDALFRGSLRMEVEPDGAVGQNRNGLLFVELQGLGLELIRRGLFLKNNAMVAQGWQVMDWAIARQRSDGGFGQNDDFHSGTIYLAALASALILDPEAVNAKRRTGLERGIAWVSHPRNSIRGMTRNLGFCHRFWLIAAMYDAAALVLERPDLSRRGSVFALDGARLQEADGTNPEAAGFDVGYHMVGIVLAARYLLTTVDDVGREAATNMLPKALDRHMVSIRPDWTISAEGSTRVGKEKGFTGEAKRVSTSQIREGYFLGWQVLNNNRYREPFERIRPSA
jgi:hypothetical protein